MFDVCVFVAGLYRIVSNRRAKYIFINFYKAQKQITHDINCDISN